MGMMNKKTRILGYAIPTWVLVMVTVGWIVPVAFLDAPMTLSDPPNTLITKVKDWVGMSSGWTSDTPEGRADLPLVKFTLTSVEQGQDDTSVVPNDADLYDANWNSIDTDACGDASIEFSGVPQGANVILVLQGSANGHYNNVKFTTPVVGENPGTTSHFLGKFEVPVALATAQADDYLYNGSVSMSGETYDASNSGSKPIMTWKEVFSPGANVQDRVLGADYIKPDTRKHHSAYLWVRTNSSAVEVVGPGSWTQVSSISYDYYYKKIPPVVCDYKSDGTYSILSHSEDIQFDIGTVGASTVAEIKVEYEDDIEDEEMARANVPSAPYDTLTLYIQD